MLPASLLITPAARSRGRECPACAHMPTQSTGSHITFRRPRTSSVGWPYKSSGRWESAWSGGGLPLPIVVACVAERWAASSQHDTETLERRGGNRRSDVTHGNRRRDRLRAGRSRRWEAQGDGLGVARAGRGGAGDFSPDVAPRLAAPCAGLVVFLNTRQRMGGDLALGRCHDPGPHGGKLAALSVAFSLCWRLARSWRGASTALTWGGLARRDRLVTGTRRSRPRICG